MAGYNFINPGAAATDTLLSLLAQRAAEQRHAMLDAIAKRTRERNEARQDEADQRARVLFDQQQQDRADAIEAEQAKAQQGARMTDLRTMFQGSLNASGDPNPEGAKATRDAMRVLAIRNGGVLPDEPKSAPTQKRTRVDTVVNGKHVQRFLTDDELAQAGDLPVYDKPQASGGTGGGSDTDAKDIAGAIMRGEQPPVFTGLYRDTKKVRAELARQGYNLTQATQDWQATSRHFASLNSPQQERIRQAIGTAADSLDVIDNLAEQWNAGAFGPFNKARLEAAKSGVLGPQAQQLATQLDAQISDVTSELAVVYQGGNTPTDHAMELAAKNLSSNWSKDTLKAATRLARTNLRIRTNSIANAQPITPSNQAQFGSGGSVTVTAPNGKTYTFKSQADADAFKAKAGIK